MVFRILDDDEGEDGEYDLEFHGGPLVAAWLPLINFAVLIAAMRWHKFSFYGHLILALIVIGLTLGATLPVLVNAGVEYEAESSLQKMHNYAGLVVVIWLGVEIVTGIFARIIQYSTKVSTNVCIWTKRFHHISSYLLMIAAKFNYLNIKFQEDQVEGSFFVLLIIDIIFLIFYLLIKFGYWTLSQEIIDNQLVVKEGVKSQNRATQLFESARVGARNLSRQIKQDSFIVPKRKKISTHYNSQSQIQLSNYVIFNDYVYDTNDFKQRHPGGQRIMSLVNKRQIDRFLYGCYGPQLQPSVKAYTHSQDSMRLCGQPIAKIDRVSPMKGFQNLNKCKISLRQSMAQASDTFLIHLTPESAKLSFQGFQFEKQIGQYFTLTITNQKGRQRCTRLYTTIWCMRPDNIKFMQKNFPFNKFSLTNKTKQNQMTEIIPHSSDRMKENQNVPLIVKRYKKGELTPHLCSSKFQGQIILSEPMGAGLKFDTISQSGSVIFVCGGTGILPFCDFIDLLFKRVKILESSNLTAMIANNDPLVVTDFIKQRSFIFYCAIENVVDLPAMTIHQINDLCKSDKVKFQCVMRVRKGQDLIRNYYPSIKFQKDYFNQNIKRHLKEGNISQVYICGPPPMNADVGKIMVENEIGSHLYHFM